MTTDHAPRTANPSILRAISNMLDAIAAVARSEGIVLDARMFVPASDDYLPVMDKEPA